MFLSLLARPAHADSTNTGRMPIDRDRTYEHNLQWEAGADKTITPAKVIRYFMGLRGQTLPPPSPTEFQPIVNAHNGQLLLVAAIAYKF